MFPPTFPRVRVGTLVLYVPNATSTPNPYSRGIVSSIVSRTIEYPNDKISYPEVTIWWDDCEVCTYSLDETTRLTKDGTWIVEVF